MKLSIIIPVYNEQDSLNEIIEKVYAVDLGDIEKEIIISNDGSRDNTFQIIEDIMTRHPDILSYHSPTNLGKGAAVRLGIAISSGEVITIQDADLELDPNDYAFLLKELLDNDLQVVYGSRFLNSQVKLKWASRIANRLLTSLTNLLFGARLTDMETAYKMFYRETIKDVKLRCVHFDFEPEITANLLKKGYPIVEIPISYHPRTVEAGKKISWVDGFEAIFTLFRCRFFR